MVEITTSVWQALAASFARGLGQRLPGWLLRLFWTEDELLRKIEVFHFDQAPQFQIRLDTMNPQLSVGGFNVFNFSPFTFSIVALDLRMSIDSRELKKYALRLPSEHRVQRYGRGGFYYEWPVAGGTLELLRKYPRDAVRIRVQGDMIIKTVFGELKKKLQADVLADIDRDSR